ncbi:MAG: Uma2 family endonuclease [Pseudanabaena sp. ELA645]
MTISGDRKLISIIDSPLEDFEPMPEGDKQRRNLSYATEALKLWFEQLPDVYVSGNLFIRYEENGAEKRIAPDIFVVFGTSREDRVSYTVWEEDGKVPDFVLEITSKGTVTKDRKQNPLIYRSLGVKEYFQYDPSGSSLKPTSLQGVRLENGKYKPIPVLTLLDNTLSLHSEVLGLDLHLFPDKTFRFYDPISKQILRSHAETEHARYQAELALSQTELERLYEHQARLEAEAAQQQAEAIANQERLAKEQAESIANQERLAKEQAESIANQERQKNETLRAYLRSIGVNPDDL